jgi:CubicO group peptidase (beta-lactamase class C family)
MRTKIDSIADNAARSYISDSATAGLSIGIYWKGKDYFYNYGEADKAKNLKANSNTVYEIGSITKTFVGYLLAKAVAEKKLALNDPITKYLPDSVASNEAMQLIKIVNLANHTSGLPRLPVDLYASKGLDPNDPYNHYNDALLFNGLKQLKPNRKPGEQYEYSNYAMGILGTILGRIYNMPFTQLVETYITKPMHLPQTTAANKVLPGQAIGYNEKLEPKNYWNFQSLAAAGSIKSNAIDLLNYGKANATLMSGTSTMAKLLTTPTYNTPPSVVTLSWHTTPDTEKPAILEHSGGTYGFRTHLTICPEQKWVVVALANQAVDPGASKVAVIIYQQLMK